jgi:hypothetical protein
MIPDNYPAEINLNQSKDEHSDSCYPGDKDLNHSNYDDDV